MKKYLLLGLIACCSFGNLWAQGAVRPAQVDSLFQLGKSLCDQENDFQAAKSPLLRALVLVDSTEAPLLYLDILDKYVKCHYRLFQSEEATKLALAGYELATELEFRAERILFIQWLGRVVEIEKRWEDALRYYGRVLELAREGEDLQVLYDAYLSVAVTHYKSGDVAAGLTKMEACQALVEQMGRPANLVADNQLWLGIMYRSRGELERALSLFLRAIPVFDSTGVLYRQTHVRMELAQTYFDLGGAEKTIKLVQDAFALAGSKLTNYEKMYGNDLLYRANRFLRRYDDAFHHLELFNATKLALKEENDARALAELTRSYELSEQQGIIEDQRQELTFAQSRTLLRTLVGSLFALLCGVLAFFLYRFKSLNTKLHRALSYQEVLRGEIHHRVSNNLQLIISLLDLRQAKKATAHELQLLRDISGKVYTIASVHQLLYRGDGDKISDFSDYVRNLVDHWNNLWDPENVPAFVLEMPTLHFNQDTLVPLGIMLNELVVNTRKYAGVPSDGQPLIIRIKVARKEAETYLLEYRDNGKGFPEEMLSLQGGNLGFHILRSMSRQLEGEVRQENNDGAVTYLQFRTKNTQG